MLAAVLLAAHLFAVAQNGEAGPRAGELTDQLIADVTTQAQDQLQLPALLAAADRSTVKLYGAGIAAEHGYGTGVIVSAEGHVITVLSLLLEATTVRCVTQDGHLYPAEVIYRDDYRQLALLKMSRRTENVDTEAPLSQQLAGAVFEPFRFAPDDAVRTGDWVFCIGNPFKVAEGEERLSVMKGVISGRTKLAATRGTQPFPYVGDVLLVDAITSGPGQPGSAIVDLQGRLVGIAGRNVTSKFTNTLLNYVMPASELQAFLRDAQTGASAATRPSTPARGPGYHGIALSKIGYRRQLPFVRSVARDSPAAKAGVKPDDLIVSANGTSIPRARDFTELVERLSAGDELTLILKRGEELISVRFTLTEVPK